MNVVLAALVVTAAAVVAWRRTAMPRVLRAAFVIGAVALSAYAFSMPAGVYSGDEGSKLVQVIALVDGQLAITYPAAEVDPDHTAFPFHPPFVLEANGARYGVYAITFTAPSAIGWRLFGWWGLFLLPVAAGLVVSWFTLSLAWRAFASVRWAIACQVLLFATPVVLNASLFNEHGVAAGLVMFGVATALPADRARSSRTALLASGLAFGAAATMRLELVALAPALAAFLIATASGDGARRLAWAMVGAAVPIAIYVAVNLATIGVMSPVLDPSYEVHFHRQPANDDLQQQGLTVGAYVLAWPLALGLVRFRRRWLEHARLAGIAAAIGVWSYACVHFYVHRDVHGQPPAALFLATPVFAVALARGPYLREPGERVARLCWCLAVAGTASLLVFIPYTGGGRLGARFLVPVMPLWVIATVAAARSSRVLAVVAAATGLLALWPQRVNHELHVAVRSRSAELVEVVAAQPHRYVGTFPFWGPQVLAPLYGVKHVYDGRRHDLVMRGIKRSGETAILEIQGPSGPRYGLGPPVKLEGGRVQVVPLR